jgi:F-type H+-transporting ATPase subunit b
MVILETIPFLLTLIGLHVIILKPMLKLLAERERNIHGFRGEAAELQDEVARKTAELEQKLKAATEQAASERARLREEAQDAERKILDDARVRAEKHVDAGRTRIQAERDAARSALDATARQLGAQVAGAVLGRPVEG